jgi:putative ABC transport system permease protein
VIATLALGFGLNTAVFSLVDGVMLRPLPYPEPERLVSLWESTTGADGDASCAATLLFWREHSRAFQQIAAYSSYAPNLTGVDEPMTLRGCQVSANMFRLLGAEAVVGRTFSDSDDRSGAESKAVLGYGFWRRVFAGDSGVIGKSIVIGGSVHTVIGVMPADFRLVLPGIAPHGEIEVLTPLTFTAEDAQNRTYHYLGAVGRLAPGVSLEQGNEELRILQGRLNQTSPEANNHFQSALAVPVKKQLVQGLTMTFALALGAAACVLVIACANVINLMLSDWVGRRKEIAIREALGAGRWRLAREFLTGSLLLALMGGIVGAVFSICVVSLFGSLSPIDLPRIEDTGLSWRVAVFSFGLCQLAGVSNGGMVLWVGRRRELAGILAENGQRAFGGGGATGSRARALLVISQMALATLLTIAATLLVQDLYKLRTVEPGFRADDLLIASVPQDPSRYSRRLAAAFYSRLLERLQTLPQVEHAEVSSGFLFTGNMRGTNIEFDQKPPGFVKDLTVVFQIVSPGYFQALRIPIVEGRSFDSSDDERMRKVIINEAMARRLWPGESPIGRRIKIYAANSEWYEIVAIVGSTRSRGLGFRIAGEIYLNYRQSPSTDLAVVMRSSSDRTLLANALRRIVLELDPDQPVAGIKTMNETLWNSLAEPRFYSTLFAFFSILALFLSVLGTYGVIAYSVASRTHEMGIRLAMGANAGRLLRLVMGHGMKIVLIGVMSGLAAAIGLMRFLSSLLYGVTAYDPWVFAAVTFILLVVALVACYIPARRVLRVDPISVLR